MTTKIDRGIAFLKQHWTLEKGQAKDFYHNKQTLSIQDLGETTWLELSHLFGWQPFFDAQQCLEDGQSAEFKIGLIKYKITRSNS